MPSLVNAKWEMFAMGLASGKSQKAAYRAAGFAAGSDSNSSTLAKRPEIQARVQELIEDRTKFKATFVDGALEHAGAVDQAAKDGNVTREWIVTELMDNARMAKEAGQFAAVNAALKMLGQEIGMFQEKKGDDAATPAASSPQKKAIAVADITKLLTHVGYKGPPIDLTQITPPEIKPAKTGDDNE